MPLWYVYILSILCIATENIVILRFFQINKLLCSGIPNYANSTMPLGVCTNTTQKNKIIRILEDGFYNFDYLLEVSFDLWVLSLCACVSVSVCLCACVCACACVYACPSVSTPSNKALFQRRVCLAFRSSITHLSGVGPPTCSYTDTHLN